MKPIWVLGNGQLGQMLRQAAEPLGITVYPLAFDHSPQKLPADAIITTEIEQWPDTPLTQQLTAHRGFANRLVFSQLTDRLTQKQLVERLGLATAPWSLLNSPEQWPSLFAQLGDTLVVKLRRGGYDGRGQWLITPGMQTQLPPELYGQAIVEQAIPFDAECSLVGARNRHDEVAFYPLTRNLHQAGILRASVALPAPNEKLQQTAEQALQKLMRDLDYIGVLAMECFLIGDRLLINELAPRVHNSAHWTQAGAATSQFSLHLRALLAWPLPTPLITTPSVMINLIGNDFNQAWLSLPLLQLHWYAKTVRPGRKVGHLNFNHPDRHLLQQALGALSPLLPDAPYPSSIEWARQQLT